MITNINDWKLFKRLNIGNFAIFADRWFTAKALRFNCKINILPKDAKLQNLKLTITYHSDLGNILDDIFYINVGDNKKSILTIIQPAKEFPYRFKIENFNRESINCELFLLKHNLNFSMPPFFPEEQTENQDLAALAAATQANAQAIANLSQAISGINENEDLNVLDPVIYTIGTTSVLISPANDSNRGVLINNQGNTKIKLFATDNTIPATTSYGSGGHIFDMTGKGIYEVPDSFVTTNIYAVGNVANGNVSVTVSREV